MKKWICAMLCIVIMMAELPAFAAISYTLPQKMEKQLAIGSGLKGSFCFQGKGDNPLLNFLPFLQNAEIQIQGLRSGDEFHYSFYQETEQGGKTGLTELYGKEGQVFLRSDFLPDEIYMIPEIEKLTDALFRSDGGNPSFASALVRWMQMDSAQKDGLLTPVTEMLSREIEIWLASYADVSEVRTLENGTSVVDLSYHIPMMDLKTEIVNLLKLVLQDEQGQALIDSIFHEEQKNIYANAELDYFYEDALAALDNGFDIQYTRTVSTIGQPVSGLLELPLDEGKMGFSSLEIEESSGMISYTLRNDEGYYTVLMNRESNFTNLDDTSIWFYMRRLSAENDREETHALRIDILHTSELSTDEESREHQTDRWMLKAESDFTKLPEGENSELYAQEKPITLDFSLHYYSRSSQSSPTTLDIEAQLEANDYSLTLSAKFKTASPWEFKPFNYDGAVDLLTLTNEERIQKWSQWLASATEQILPVKK